MSHPWESLANEHILGIAPYEPGKPIEELERELGITDVIKLASNENPLAPSERVLKAIAEALPHLNRYPDGSGYYLRQALGRRHGLSADHIILGNGSNDLIELLARAFLRAGEEAVIPHPSFVVYPMIVQAVGGIRVVVTLKDYRLDLEAMARAMTPMTKMVFIANPNNPTATIVTADEVDHFMARVPDQAIVVFDEAYLEFAQGPDFPDTLNYLRHGRKVVILSTFSKAASLAGLRVGYAMADPDCVALLNRIRQPFNVNSIAQVAALAALEDDSHVLECVRMIEAGRHYLCDEFTALGLKYAPSRANFIFVDVGKSATRRLPVAPQGRRHRPAHDELRHGARAPRDHRHAGREPALRQGPQESAGRGQGRVIRRLTLLGLGLLGGSVAKAARADGLAREIVAVGRRRESLEPALQDGTVDRITLDVAEGVAGADLCVLCHAGGHPHGAPPRRLARRRRRRGHHRRREHQGGDRERRGCAGQRAPARLRRQPSHGGLRAERLWRGACRSLSRRDGGRDAHRAHGAGSGEARDGALGVARRAGDQARPGLP